MVANGDTNLLHGLWSYPNSCCWRLTVSGDSTGTSLSPPSVCLHTRIQPSSMSRPARYSSSCSCDGQNSQTITVTNKTGWLTFECPLIKRVENSESPTHTHTHTHYMPWRHGPGSPVYSESNNDTADQSKYLLTPVPDISSYKQCIPCLFWPTGHGCCSTLPLLSVYMCLFWARCYTCIISCVEPDVGFPTPTPHSCLLSCQRLTKTRKRSPTMNLYRFCSKPLSARNTGTPAEAHFFGNIQCTCLKTVSFPGWCEGCRPETSPKVWER